jgi:hypothetical protein
MNNAKLTVRLPEQDLDFVREYARSHGMTLAALVHRFISQLRRSRMSGPTRDLAPITGLIPSDVDARDEFAGHH